MTVEEKPQLAAPGAGVAWWQRLGGKYLLLPLFCARHSWDAAVDRLDREGRELLELPAGRDLTAWTRRVLVPPQIGLEDSSRHWSLSMVLEHLVIIGQASGLLIRELTHGRQPPGRVNTADLKPSGHWSGVEAEQRFVEMLEDYRRRVLDEVGDRQSPTRHVHPWFGPLTAFEWVCFLPFHQRIHRRQAQRILHRLP